MLLRAFIRLSTRWILLPAFWPRKLSGRSITWIARAVQQVLQRYKELQDIIAIMGMDELSEDDKITVNRAVRYSVFFHSRSMLRSSLPVCPASMCR